MPARYRAGRDEGAAGALARWGMRQVLVLAVLLIAACGGPTSTAPSGDPPGDSPTAGGPGSICAVGDQHPEGTTVTAVACADGLQCCYPCGIDGCDSVCMADCGPPRP